MNLQPGHVIGAWKILEPQARGRYLCVCTGCGKSTRRIRTHDLIAGKTLMCRSCSMTGTKVSKPPEYGSWAAMIQRCYNPNCRDYVNYGARGISVYPLWRESFDAFLMHLGPRPAPGDTLERLDVNGHYEPGNVVWLARKEQPKNQRSNVRITIDGVTKTVTEWGEDPECPVPRSTIYKRISSGWDPKLAVFTPSRRRSDAEE